MDVHVPDDIKAYEPELRFFMELMVRKLHLNRHKGFADRDTVPIMVKALNGEVSELITATQSESQFSVALEAADVANMAFLLSLVALRQNKKDFEDARNNA